MIQRRSENLKDKEKGSRPSSSPRRNSLEKGTPGRKESFREGNSANLLHLSKRGDCPKENACHYWHPPGCSFHQEGDCKLWSNCAVKHTEQAGGEPKKRKHSVVVAKTLDYTHSEDKITSPKFIAKGDLLHGVIHSSEINFTDFLNNIVNKFRLSRVGEEFLKEREKKGHTLGIKQQGGQSGRSPDALS